MEDEKYVFIEDVKTRKDVARSARKKKNGAKSRKVTFPSDYLTKKEREKMNGECKTWNLNEFYTWAEFKKMPVDIAAAYISTLNQKYKVSMMNIAEKLFHIGKPTFSTYIHKKGISDLMKIKMYNNRGEHNRNLVEFENAIIAAKVAKETVPADIFIPDGMAPGYCSDGTKVEDAIKKAVDEANKKLMEDGSISAGEIIEEPKNECLFFDSFSNRSFWATKDAVSNAIDEINRQIFRFPTVNDFYFILGLPPVEQGDARGWRPEMKEYEFDPCLRVDKTIDGKECIVIDYLPYYINEFKKANCTNDTPVTRLNVTMNGIDSDRIADILSWFTGKDVMVTLIVQEKIDSEDYM